MKAKDLIEQLEFTEEAEIIIMSQPDRNPLYYRIRNFDVVDGEDNKTYIILEEGGQIGYSFGKLTEAQRNERAEQMP